MKGVYNMVAVPYYEDNLHTVAFGSEISIKDADGKIVDSGIFHSFRVGNEGVTSIFLDRKYFISEKYLEDDCTIVPYQPVSEDANGEFIHHSDIVYNVVNGEQFTVMRIYDDSSIKVVDSNGFYYFFDPHMVSHEKVDSFQRLLTDMRREGDACEEFAERLQELMKR